ncbi:unnamed protein product [Vitrella brassicaformis CCMP3155]|uniref:Uncharacterized protein n=1 Tax=Vitrella brassicaformis (strain CCMP3155) TaxID=1169540 RepID=A0A0G4FU75_VITBC|nr:unnamed protein product [Vitrella brassicaformis CCMP3155]|eukprot:CEM18516.1 unnamed protein product [Vitrella brassicaformis CCMP3155]
MWDGKLGGVSSNAQKISTTSILSAILDGRDGKWFDLCFPVTAAVPVHQQQLSRFVAAAQREEEATAMASDPSGPPQPPAILRLKSGDDIELPIVLGSGTRATVTAGLVNGEWTEFKIAAPPEGSQQVSRSICREMEAERATMERLQQRQRERNERGLFLDVYEYAGPSDGADFRASPSAPPQQCVYLAEEVINDPPSANTHPADQKAMGMIDKLLTTVRALREGVRGHRRALDDYDTVLLDHCVNNIYVRRIAMGGGVSDRAGVLFIDHDNTLHGRQPGPLLRRSDGTIPSPPYPQKAALAPLSSAAVEKEQQLPINTHFCGPPEQLLHW